MKQKTGGIREYDWTLLMIAFAICGMGVLEIRSATHMSHLAGMEWRQLSWIGMGLFRHAAALAPGLPCGPR